MTKKAEAEKRPPGGKAKVEGAKRGQASRPAQNEQSEAAATIPAHLIRPKG